MKKITKRILTSLLTCLPLVSVVSIITRQAGNNLLSSNKLDTNLYDYSDLDNGEPPIEPTPEKTSWLDKKEVAVSEIKSDWVNKPMDEISDAEFLDAVRLHLNLFYQDYPEDNDSKLTIKVSQRWPLQGYISVNFSMEYGYVDQELTKYPTPLGGTVNITGFKLIEPTNTRVRQISLPSFVDFQNDNIEQIKSELLKIIIENNSLPYNANPRIEIGKLQQASHVNTTLLLDHYYDSNGFVAGPIDIQIVALSTNPNKNLETSPTVVQNGIDVKTCQDSKNLAIQSLNTISDEQLKELIFNNLKLFFRDLRPNLTTTDYKVENIVRTASVGKVSFRVTVLKSYVDGLKENHPVSNTVTIFGFKTQQASQMEPRTIDLPPDLPIRQKNLQAIKQLVLKEAQSLKWPDGSSLYANDPTITNGTSLTFTITVTKYYDETGATKYNGTFPITALSTSKDRDANTVWRDPKVVNILEGIDNERLLETTTNEVTEAIFKSFIVRNIDLLFDDAPSSIPPNNLTISDVSVLPIKGSITCQVHLSYTMTNGLPDTSKTLGGKVTFTGFKVQPPSNLENRSIDLPPEILINKDTLSDIRAIVESQIPKFDLHLPPDCDVNVQIPTTYSAYSAVFPVSVTKYYDAQGKLQPKGTEFNVTCICTNPKIGKTTESKGISSIDSSTSTGSNVLQGKTVNDINQGLAQEFVFDNREKLFSNLPANVTKTNFNVSIINNLSTPKDGELVVNVLLNKTLEEGNDSTKTIRIENLRITGLKQQLPTSFNTCIYKARDVQTKYFSDVDTKVIENDAKQFLREKNNLPPNIGLETLMEQSSREGAVFKFSSPQYYNSLGWKVNRTTSIYVSVTGFKENNKLPTAQEIIDNDLKSEITIIESKDEISWWVWLAIGSSIFLVIMIIITIFVTLSRKKEERRRKELLEQKTNHNGQPRVEYKSADANNKKLAPPPHPPLKPSGVINKQNNKPNGAPVFKPNTTTSQPAQKPGYHASTQNHQPMQTIKNPHGPTPSQTNNKK